MRNIIDLVERNAPSIKKTLSHIKNLTLKNNSFFGDISHLSLQESGFFRFSLSLSEEAFSPDKSFL